ncbi:MAG: hypothetical protein ACE5GS_13980 [Kiloniellaceae bacterium]
MQIPANAFPFGPGFLRQPQPGTRQQIDPELQAKANAPGARAAAKPAAPAVEGGPAAAGPGLAAALSAPGAARALERAVETLAAEGRLPPRGSLIDLRA